MPPDPTSTTVPVPVHLTAREIDAGLDDVRGAPRDQGSVELIARRPDRDERDVLDEAQLDMVVGLVGDMWHTRASSSSPDGGPHPDRQLTLMNVRFARLVAGGDDGRAVLAGDQLYVDLDLGEDNLPPGSRLRIGDRAVVEVTAEPHTGCGKFTARFGADAFRTVNSPEGMAMRLRGANVRVVEPGPVRRGDAIVKL